MEVNNVRMLLIIFKKGGNFKIFAISVFDRRNLMSFVSAKTYNMKI
jgi:hypothetical protein